MNGILIAGFGGQGVLFSGKFLVYGGMITGRQVSWLPSYGPEMRGGTANCGVILSDTAIGSPIVTKPDVLIVMNLPSLDKYEPDCVPGASVIIDESLISRKLNRRDINGHYIPASQLAEENELKGLANMIMIGATIRLTKIIPYESIGEIMRGIVPERKKDLLGKNMTAIDLGYNYFK